MFMKKKFINGLLMAAMVFGATSSMISCKDYDDEKIVDLQGMLADKDAELREIIDAKVKDLQRQIDDLSRLQRECRENCQTKFDEVYAKFGNYYTKTEIDTKYGDLMTFIQTNYLTETQIIELLKKHMGYPGSDKTLQEVFNLWLENNDLIQNLTTQINNLNTLTTQIKATADQALELAQQNQQAIEDLKPRVEKNEEAIEALDSLANENKQHIENLTERVTNIETTIIGWGERLTAVETKAAENEVRSKADSIRIDNLILDVQNKYDELKSRDQQLADSLKQVYDNMQVLRDSIAIVDKKVDDLRIEVMGLIDEANDRIDSVENRLGDLEDKFNTFEQEVKEKLDDLEDRLTAVEEQVQANTEAIEELQGFQEKVKNAMAKYISGIIINKTMNPVFGSVNLPVDARTTILANYHGYTSDQGVEFPGFSEGYYASDADWNRVKNDGAILQNVKEAISKSGAQVLLTKDGQEGNAGTLYLTINPTNRDFSGTEFVLINSKNEESPVKLSDIRKSDHLINFGWNRARQTGEQSANGFYEAQATIDNAALFNARTHLNLDFQSMKNVVADVKNWRDGISATNIATAIYANVNDVLEADALKATWTDDVSGEEMSVVSQYAIAATSVKPLGYGFLKDVKYNDQLLEVETFANQIFNKFDNMLKPLVDRYNTLVNYILELKYKDYDPETNTLTIVALLPEGTFEEDVKVVWNSNHTKCDTVWSKNADGTFDVNIRFSAMEDLMATLIKIYGSEDEVKNQIDKVKNQIDNLLLEIKEDLLGQLDSATLKETMGITKLYDYIEILNKHFRRWLVPNKYMQPMLIAHNDNQGYVRLSRVKRAPSVLNSTTFSLRPTTFNVEVLSPAYKKIVVATNVYDANGVTNEAARNAFNEQENVNQVIDGEWQKFDVNIEKGYTYEILYMALDYSGEIAARKYYVKVK